MDARKQEDAAAQKKDGAAEDGLRQALQKALARAETAEQEAVELKEEAEVMNEALKVRHHQPMIALRLVSHG